MGQPHPLGLFPMGSAEAAHLMTFLCQTESAKKPQTLLPPQMRDDDAA